jgi:imidazolonepropionase-like amidohydrolase
MIKREAKKRSVLLSLLAAAVLSACRTTAPAPTAPPVAANRYAIVDVTVVDVEKGTAVPGQTVLVTDERIDEIGPTKDLGIPEGARTIDGHSLYLMPGLVDAHVHFFDPPVFGRTMIANGVLLVRDVGLPTEEAMELRDELNRGELLGPEMVATGALVDGYPPLIPDISLGVQTPQEGREAVRQQAAAGVDMIKVYSRLDKETFLAIVDEAQKLGIKAVGHVPESVYIEDAAAAGLSSSEHLFGFEKVIAKLLGAPVNLTYVGMGADAGYLLRLNEVKREELQGVYQRLRASGLTVCPTVIVYQTGTRLEAIFAGDFSRSEYISQTVLDIWKTQWSQQSQIGDALWQSWAQMVQQLNQAGIPLMVGTDLVFPGIIPGFAVHEEMAIWQDAGISPADVLQSATIVPAQFMGLDHRLGTIAEGKAASMVLVDANPLEDIRNAQQIKGVFLRGQYLNGEDIERLLVEAKDLARRATP